MNVAFPCENSSRAVSSCISVTSGGAAPSWIGQQQGRNE